MLLWTSSTERKKDANPLRRNLDGRREGEGINGTVEPYERQKMKESEGERENQQRKKREIGRERQRQSQREAAVQAPQGQSSLFKRTRGEPVSFPPSILYRSLRPPVDESRLVRNDRAQRLTHTHRGYNSMGSIWVSVCVLLRGSSLREHTHTHTHAHTFTRIKLIKKDQPSRGDGGQLSEAVKSEPVSKKIK